MKCTIKNEPLRCEMRVDKKIHVHQRSFCPTTPCCCCCCCCCCCRCRCCFCFCICALCSTATMRRLPNDASGGAIAGCPASAAAALLRDVDLCWFLAHAMFSIARGKCGLSWPTLLFGSIPKNQTQTKTCWKIWTHLGHFGSCFLEVDYFLGSGE